MTEETTSVETRITRSETRVTLYYDSIKEQDR